MRVPSLAEATLALSPNLAADKLHLAARTATIWATPHDSYSSSVGVLGCKINTNRVAYWPQAVDCDDVCVEVEYRDRSVYLLRVDQSAGAHDISYDAWNYLYAGRSAADEPAAGGAVEMTYRTVEASECGPLLYTDGRKLPVSAANGMNFLADCLRRRPGSWVARNYVAVNIYDAICTLGVDEECSLDWPAANQPTCRHALGALVALKDRPVYNIQYPSGKKILAGSGGGGGEENGALIGGRSSGRGILPAVLFVILSLNLVL